MDKKILWIVLVCIFRTTLSQFPTGGPTGEPTEGCNEDEFKCDTTDECFTSSWKCDGIVDCSDESDESDCPATNGPPTGGPPTGGPHTGGPHTGGPHTGGPHTGGPHTGGPHTYGPYTGGPHTGGPHTGGPYTGGPHTGGPYTGGPHTGGPPTGVPPCGDSTPNPPGTCNADEFKCDTTDQCFTLAWKCDGIVDCSDDSDEKDCPDQPTSTVPPTGGPTGTCNADEFKCDTTDQCFTLAWKCDGIVDCSDDSDEKDCPDQPTSTVPPTGGPTGTCNADEFKCDTTDQCFTLAWKCDGIVDCSDDSDEKDCPDQPSSTVLPTGGPTVPPTGGPTGTCNADEFKCDTTDQCFTLAWKCDGIVDCSDDSDEKDCPATNGPPTGGPTGGPPTSGPSGCGSDNGKCDGYVDCADGSDEQGCDTFTCPSNKEKCGNGQKDRLICILKSAFCDGYQDCPDGGDENEGICKARTCDAGEIRCPEGACLPASTKCNGWPECSNGADEVGCTGCPGSGRRCADGKMCVEGSAFCDGMLDCPDQSDEANCGGGPSKRGMLYRRFERLLHQLRSRERRSAPKTVAQRALKTMEDARHKRHMSALNRRRMETSRKQSRTDTRGLQSIRRKLRERKIHRAKLEKLAERKAAMTRRRQQRRSRQG